jgi:hypothetical protein
VAPVDAENELVFPSHDAHVPIVVRRDPEWHRRKPSRHWSRKDANEANVILIHRGSLERRAALESEHVRTLAKNHLRIERQTTDELRAKRLDGARIANDEQARGSDVDDVETLQLLGQERRAKPPMSANVRTTQERYDCHAALFRAERL